MNKENDPQPEAPMPTTATTVKDEVIEMLRRLPDDITLEEIQHRIYVLELLKESEGADEEGLVVAHDEVKPWPTPSLSPYGKVEVIDMLHRLPDDLSLEDIQYHIYVLEKTRRGLESADTGPNISQEEAEAEFERWLTE